jgi:high-affinity iron transporter
MTAVTAFQAAAIILREGAEALLVIAALAAYLGRIGQGGRCGVLYWGAAVAVALSLAVAWIFESFLGGGHNDLVEGIVMLVAAGVLVWVSGWLMAHRDVAAWRGYLQGRVGEAVGTGSLLTLGFAAFLAVFREGAETVLFLHALAGSAGGWGLSMVAGIVTGLGILMGAFLLVRRLAVRLPLKPFFVGTAALLFVLALTFVGQSMAEFQEMGWISHTDAEVPEWLVGIGVGPTWEAIIAQLVLVFAGPLTSRVVSRRAPAARATEAETA